MTLIPLPLFEDLTIWHVGSGDPSSELGEDGHFYLQTSDGDTGSLGDVWEKASGSWGVTGNIRGATGADGATWHSGASDPSTELGEDGDLYLQTDDGSTGQKGDVWEKVSGSWSQLVNIRGMPGQDGDDGEDGADGATWHTGEADPGSGLGDDGDLYLQTADGSTGATGDVWEKSGGSWSVLVNIRGMSGEDGEDGNDGEDGAQWFHGATDPASGLGSDGDFYLQTADGDTGQVGDIWEKAAGSWSVVGNLRGPAGQDGTGTGDVVGPESSTDEHVAVFDGTDGKKLKGGGVSVADIAARADGITTVHEEEEGGYPTPPAGYKTRAFVGWTKPTAQDGRQLYDFWAQIPEPVNGD